MGRYFFMAAALLLTAASAEARNFREPPIVAAPARTTGYPPRFGPNPYYDAGTVYGFDGTAGYYDGWRTRAPWYNQSSCATILERRTVWHGRAVVRKYCLGEARY